METILLDVTANQHLPNYIARYDAINKSRNPWPEVLCKYELLNFNWGVENREKRYIGPHRVFDVSS